MPLLSDLWSCYGVYVRSHADISEDLPMLLLSISACKCFKYKSIKVKVVYSQYQNDAYNIRLTHMSRIWKCHIWRGYIQGCFCILEAFSVKAHLTANMHYRRMTKLLICNVNHWFPMSRFPSLEFIWRRRIPMYPIWIWNKRYRTEAYFLIYI